MTITVGFCSGIWKKFVKDSLKVFSIFTYLFVLFSCDRNGESYCTLTLSFDETGWKLMKTATFKEVPNVRVVFV